MKTHIKKKSKKSQEKVSGYFLSVVVRSQLKMYVNHDWMEIWLSSFLLIANMKLIKSSSDYWLWCKKHTQHFSRVSWGQERKTSLSLHNIKQKTQKTPANYMKNLCKPTWRVITNLGFPDLFADKNIYQ